MRSRGDEQRSLYDDAGHAEQHDVCRGGSRDTGHSAAARRADSEPEWQRDARSAGELYGSQHGAGAEHRESAVADHLYAASGHVARVAVIDHRRKRRGGKCDPAALYAGHRSRLDDNAAGDPKRAVHGSAVAEHAGDSRNDRAGHLEPAGNPE